jgi:hypothetical protein
MPRNDGAEEVDRPWRSENGTKPPQRTNYGPSLVETLAAPDLVTAGHEQLTTVKRRYSVGGHWRFSVLVRGISPWTAR